MHWNKRLGIIYDVVADFMSRDRFMQIKSNLHLVDNEANNSTDDKLSKVRPLIDHLHSKFQDIPMDQELCIEEQMVPFKGASGIKQYIPTKPNKWGYEFFVLADKTGLIHDFMHTQER